MAAFGGLDVLVSNAGFADRTPFAGLTDAAMTASVEAIQGAFFRLARAAIPHLSAGRDARVIAVSSFVAHAFRTDTTVFPASAAAKAALEALVRVLAIELAPAGVTVNAVVPGFIRKDPGAHAAMDPERLRRQVAAVPLGRVGLPDEVAAAIAFLASPAAGYITGQALHVRRWAGDLISGAGDDASAVPDAEADDFAVRTSRRYGSSTTCSWISSPRISVDPGASRCRLKAIAAIGSGTPSPRSQPPATHRSSQYDPA